MPDPVRKVPMPVVLVWGDDDFGVKQRSRQIYEEWSRELGGMDHETIDAAAGNSAEALKAIARLREALQTLPFFGSGKAIWFQGCNFLSDERTANAQMVSEALAVLTQELKSFNWDNVRLLVSATKIDKRKVLFKTLERIGTVETFEGLSIDDRDWVAQAESAAIRLVRASDKRISDQALSELVASVGPDLRQLRNEIQKLLLYIGDRTEIGIKDVGEIVTRNKLARAFALGDALGDRDLPRLLRCLDEELWGMRSDNQKSEIGLLYGLVTKIRVLIFLKELLTAGWLKLDSDYNRFKSRLERVPSGTLPEDKRFNPLAMNPYVLFKALPQAGNYSTGELVRAMELLLECNQQLFSRLNKRIVLQRALMQIASRTGGRPASAAA